MPLAGGLAVLAVGAFLLGAYAAGATGHSQRVLVRRYLNAWTHDEFTRMYALLSPAARRRIGKPQFVAAYRTAAATATAVSLRFSHTVSLSGNTASVRATVRTHAFGTLHERLQIALDPQDRTHLDFAPMMVFPGLRPGETLSRSSTLGARGTIEAADGTPLAEGPGRTSPIPQVAGEIVGTLGPIPAAQRSYYDNLGYPADAQVGQDGLEMIFQRRLAGRPGGTLRAGRRVLASVTPQPGATVRTTINPQLEAAAIQALNGAYAGMTVINYRTGAIEAAAGLAFNDLQPPGSTFKIITASAALQDGVATLNSTYPMESKADVGGFIMQNAAGEVCGGTLLVAFAVSCDTTYAPLGIQIGGPRLVAEAERFGFNHPTGIPGALESTIPSAATIGDATAVGATAIGQGQLETTTLEMADAGATIANGGRRPLPTLLATAPPRFVTATTPQVAGEVQTMMQAVVSFGTGVSAQIPGYRPAGKTGTAELANTAGQANNTKETDAWFVGFVPDSSADVVACALFPANGYGATSAAPAVRSLLVAALSAG
ncbi:penicillin-binding transpeptidase domain-containing protein [Conexibacter sp. DBS9H8]|uniref:penicillin-binding transpeptidase domain-containing protein n=1 Tax=Conexibacter sp. DBS9H8 TaxID=2937801 RepID=UPI00200ED850|nr:penicillin-binding transpeptidase domain-containing protein [Conexibacter sp. DBS9H8]